MKKSIIFTGGIFFLAMLFAVETVFAQQQQPPKQVMPGSKKLGPADTRHPPPPIPVWKGTKQWGSDKMDQASAVAVDANGNVYVVGSTKGSWDGQQNQGGSDAFITKFRAGGNREWTRIFGSPADDGASAVAVDAGGHIYVVGSTAKGWDLYDRFQNGKFDAFIAKFDASGNRLWTRFLGSWYDDQARAVAVDRNSGHIYVTGYTDGYLEGEPTRINPNAPDAFIAKYSPDGTIQWVRYMCQGRPELCGADEGHSVAVDADGFVYMVGTRLVNRNEGAFLVKYDPAGNRMWENGFSATQRTTEGYGVAVSPDVYYGNRLIYMVGMTNFASTNYSGGFDAFLAMFWSTTGERRIDKCLGSPADDYARGVAGDGDGNIYLTGNTRGDFGDKKNLGNGDCFLARYDRGLNLKWYKLLQTTATDSCMGVAVDPNGNVFVTGSTNGGMDGNANAGNEDAFLAKFSPSGVLY